MTSKPSDRTLSRHDLAVGVVIAAALGVTFAALSSGWSLIVTFVPGLAVTLGAFVWLYRTRTAIPEAPSFLPPYFLLLAVQFLHFGEEYTMGFSREFPALYGGAPYPDALFVDFNMVAYFVFTVAAIAAFATRRWFLLLPVIFFVVYGAIGNALSHSWWSLWLGRYFPGLVTAQAYWVLGPLVLLRLLGSRAAVAAVLFGLAIVMLPLLTYFAVPGPS